MLKATLGYSFLLMVGMQSIGWRKANFIALALFGGLIRWAVWLAGLIIWKRILIKHLRHIS